MTHSNRNRDSSKSESPRKKHKKSKKKHHKRNKRESSSETCQSKYRSNNEKYDATGSKYGSQNSKKDICGYTDDANPFMDSNLTQPFIWKKKKFQVPLNIQQKEMELKNVQKRMQDHERARQERELEQEIIQRAKEVQYSFGRQSDSAFDLEQAKIRSKIRITGGRGKPIDLLIQYINEENTSESDTDAIMYEPTQYLLGLSDVDLEDLLVDIHDYSKNMEPGKNMQYWEDIKVVAESELAKISNKSADGRNEGVAKECVEDMKQMFMQGTTEDAVELYNDAKHMLETGDRRHIDVAYYEYFCKLAKVIIAKRRLQDRHSKNLQIKLKQLKHEQGLSTEQHNIHIPKEEIVYPNPTHSSKKESRLEREEYDYEKYEPVLIQENDLGDEALENVIYLAEDDEQKLEFMRKKFLQCGSHSCDNEDELLKLAQKDDEKGDSNFVEQVVLDEKSFLWSDKYRPRKPRFLNRVNTGYDWNKYNQTHYDVDNPPPKIVQGYKFNILYPDLIDKSKTPTYELMVCNDNDQQAILTFKAGPPYQDIAFKIVNREWETSERYGYKCQFYRDMLQLHFHFKRYRYRK